jgi:hypothetical protein
MHARSFFVEALCPNFISKDTPFICAPPWNLQAGICPEWTNVGWNTGYKGYTSIFYDNPKGWTRPQGTGKIPISTI